MPQNMSYCRFENTFEAMKECRDALEESGVEGLSKDEQKYAKRLLKLCGELAADYGEDLEGA